MFFYNIARLHLTFQFVEQIMLLFVRFDAVSQVFQFQLKIWLHFKFSSGNSAQLCFGQLSVNDSEILLVDFCGCGCDRAWVEVRSSGQTRLNVNSLDSCSTKHLTIVIFNVSDMCGWYMMGGLVFQVFITWLPFYVFYVYCGNSTATCSYQLPTLLTVCVCVWRCSQVCFKQSLRINF